MQLRLICLCLKNGLKKECDKPNKTLRCFNLFIAMLQKKEFDVLAESSQYFSNATIILIHNAINQYNLPIPSLQTPVSVLPTSHPRKMGRRIASV